MGILNWNQLEVKEVKLKSLQRENLSKIKKTLNSLGFKIVKIKETGDGWMTGFTLYEFHCKDKRAPPLYKDQIKIFSGSDDNSAIYENYASGGRGLFAHVKGAKTL